MLGSAAHVLISSDHFVLEVVTVSYVRNLIPNPCSSAGHHHKLSISFKTRDDEIIKINITHKNRHTLLEPMSATSLIYEVSY